MGELGAGSGAEGEGLGAVVGVGGVTTPHLSQPATAVTSLPTNT